MFWLLVFYLLFSKNRHTFIYGEDVLTAGDPSMARVSITDRALELVSALKTRLRRQSC